MQLDELVQDPTVIAVAIAVLLIIGVVIALIARRRRARRDRLQRRFGAEYERTVRAGRSRRQAEEDLEVRRQRREGLELRVLTAEERDHYRGRFEEFQASFVDAPDSALRGADGLIDEVAAARGYRQVDGISRLGLISVDHPDEVAAHQRGLSHLSAGGRPGTEDLRQALLSARRLLERLVSAGEDGEAAAPAPPRTYLGLDEGEDDADTSGDGDGSVRGLGDAVARDDVRDSDRGDDGVRDDVRDDVHGDGGATRRGQGAGSHAVDGGEGDRQHTHDTLGSRADDEGRVTETVDLTVDDDTRERR